MFERWEALGNIGEEDQTRCIGVTCMDVPQRAADGIRNMKDGVDRNATVSPIIGDCLMEQMKNTDATIVRAWDRGVAGKCNETKNLMDRRGPIEGQQLGLSRAGN
jgi:hypothetical protein